MSMENVPAGPGPYNSLAIGEVANTPTAAAVANAVADACGVRITDLPVTSEKVYQALRARTVSCDEGLQRSGTRRTATNRPNARLQSDLFPLRRGKIEMGVLEESKITPSLVLPRRGEGNGSD